MFSVGNILVLLATISSYDLVVN